MEDNAGADAPSLLASALPFAVMGLSVTTVILAFRWLQQRLVHVQQDNSCCSDRRQLLFIEANLQVSITTCNSLWQVMNSHLRADMNADMCCHIKF